MKLFILAFVVVSSAFFTESLEVFHQLHPVVARYVAWWQQVSVWWAFGIFVVIVVVDAYLQSRPAKRRDE